MQECSRWHLVVQARPACPPPFFHLDVGGPVFLFIPLCEDGRAVLAQQPGFDLDVGADNALDAVAVVAVGDAHFIAEGLSSSRSKCGFNLPRTGGHLAGQFTQFVHVGLSRQGRSQAVEGSPLLMDVAKCADTRVPSPE